MGIGKFSILLIVAVFAIAAAGQEGTQSPAAATVKAPPVVASKEPTKTADAAAEKTGSKAEELEKVRQRAAVERSEYEKKDQEYISAIDAHADKIEKLLNSREEWTRDTDGEGKTNGLGEIESLRLRATFFAIERGFRREVEREIRELIKLKREWLAYRADFKKKIYILELEEKVLALEQKGDVGGGGSGPATVRKEDFEFYEVKTAATLSQISALPEIYGDPTLFLLIYNANKDKVTDPEKPIPAGTVLVIPNLIK